MKRTPTILLAFALAAAALAGCAEQEARDDTDHRETLTVDLPDGTTDVLVEFVAWDHAANETTRVAFTIEDDDDNTLADDSFFVANETRHEVETPANNASRIHVTAEVVEGAADVEIAVWAIVPGEEPQVIIREKVIVHEETRVDDADPADPGDAGEPADPADPADPGEDTMPGDGNETNGNDTNGNETVDEQDSQET